MRPQCRELTMAREGPCERVEGRSVRQGGAHGVEIWGRRLRRHGGGQRSPVHGGRSRDFSRHARPTSSGIPGVLNAARLASGRRACCVGARLPKYGRRETSLRPSGSEIACRPRHDCETPVRSRLGKVSSRGEFRRPSLCRLAARSSPRRPPNHWASRNSPPARWQAAVGRVDRPIRSACPYVHVLA